MSEIRSGDVIVWRTWSGEAVVQVEWLNSSGNCGIKSTDGYTSFHERIPNSARLADGMECAKFFARLQPDRPIAYE